MKGTTRPAAEVGLVGGHRQVVGRAAPARSGRPSSVLATNSSRPPSRSVPASAVSGTSTAPAPKASEPSSAASGDEASIRSFRPRRFVGCRRRSAVSGAVEPRAAVVDRGEAGEAVGARSARSGRLRRRSRARARSRSRPSRRRCRGRGARLRSSVGEAPAGGPRRPARRDGRRRARWSGRRRRWRRGR